VNGPIALGPMTTVNTRAFVETVLWIVIRPNGSATRGLLVVVLILLHKVSQLLNTILM
jgi:hypothetical protein